jgi:hypothetical protein
LRVAPTVIVAYAGANPFMQIGIVGGTIDISTAKAQLKLEYGNNERGHSVGGLDILSAIR